MAVESAKIVRILGNDRSLSLADWLIVHGEREVNIKHSLVRGVISMEALVSTFIVNLSSPELSVSSLLERSEMGTLAPGAYNLLLAKGVSQLILLGTGLYFATSALLAEDGDEDLVLSSGVFPGISKGIRAIAK